MFNKLDLQEIPPLVYQLLLLSSKVCVYVCVTLCLFVLFCVKPISIVCQGCKKQILDGIIDYFKEKDTLLEEEKKDGKWVSHTLQVTNTVFTWTLLLHVQIVYYSFLHSTLDLEVQSIPQDQLRHVEGTTILHVVFAIRLDHELGREFLKIFKVTL